MEWVAHLIDWIRAFVADHPKIGDRAVDLCFTAFGAAAGYWLRDWVSRGNLTSMNFDNLLDVSVTQFAEGKMEIRTQLEEDLRHLLPGEKNGVFVRWIRKAAKKTAYDQVLLDLAKASGNDKAPKLTYDTLRNVVFGQFVNVLDQVSRTQFSNRTDMVRFVGALTCEPQFWPHSAGARVAVPVIEVLPRRFFRRKAETKRKVRLLLFTARSVAELLQWTRMRAVALGKSPHEVLAELCSEKDVVLGGSGPLPKGFEKGDRINELMAHMGRPERDLDRKRYVAMAQVARAIQNGEPHLRFDVPVPRQGVVFPAPRALRGEYFPKNAASLEETSLNALSFEMRARIPPGGLYYKGANGTATAIVSRGSEILLIRKTLQGRTTWALPGGFLLKDQPALRENLVRELCEEAVLAEPGDAHYAELRQRCLDSAELVYLGTVLDARCEAEAWIVDHVYHLDCSGMTFGLRKQGATDTTEEVEEAQWVPLGSVFGEELFASHGTMILAWTREHLRRLDAGERSILQDLSREEVERLRREIRR